MRWSRSTRSTGARAAWRATASRRLPRTPAAPLQRPVGAQPDARDSDGRPRHRVAGANPRVGPGDDRPRRLPPGQHHVRAGAPARLAAIFDWELATIGDPLADVGYLTATYAEPGDAQGTLFALGAVTCEPGFPSARRADRPLRGALGPLHVRRALVPTLALWKSAIFLEGSYKRLLAGTTDDPFFKLLDAGVPELAEHARGGARRVSGATAPRPRRWAPRRTERGRFRLLDAAHSLAHVGAGEQHAVTG